MLRIACCEGIEAGIEIVAPVHDAVLIHARISDIERDIERMRAIMAKASRIVLGGFELRTEAETFEYPRRFMDEDRGRVMWELIMKLLDMKQRNPNRGSVFRPSRGTKTDPVGYENRPRGSLSSLCLLLSTQ